MARMPCCDLPHRAAKVAIGLEPRSGIALERIVGRVRIECLEALGALRTGSIGDQMFGLLGRLCPGHDLLHVRSDEEWHGSFTAFCEDLRCEHRQHVAVDGRDSPQKFSLGGLGASWSAASTSAVDARRMAAAVVPSAFTTGAQASSDCWLLAVGIKPSTWPLSSFAR